MGKLAKIEAGKTSSDAFAGCAPVEWLKEKCQDFAEWVAKGVFDLGSAVKNFFSSAFKWLKDFALQIPGVKQAQQSFGVMISVGSKVAKEAGKCAQVALKGLKIVGALAATAGGIALLQGTGLLGGVATVLTLGVLSRWFIRSTGKVYRFNWNITDAQIKERYKASMTALSSQAGSVVGAGLAHLVCGVGGSTAVLALNPTAIALTKEVLEESWEEIVGNAKALIRTTGSAIQEWILLETFRNVRSLIKKAARFPGIKNLLPGKIAEAIEYWGSPNSKPWSFAKTVEDSIESIGNKNLAAFFEEAREEFADVCTQNAYALTKAG